MIELFMAPLTIALLDHNKILLFFLLKHKIVQGIIRKNDLKLKVD